MFTGQLTIARIISTVCMAFVLTCSGSQNDGHLARGGVLDLSGWDFERDGPATLSGDWKLNWGEFTPPDNPLGAAPNARVPRSWDQLGIEGVSGRGFGTFRLVVRGLPATDTGLMIALSSMTGAYRLYCGDALIASAGQIGETYETTIPKRIPRLAILPPGCIKQNEAVLTWHVANFRHRTGGGAAELTSTMPIGLAEQTMDSVYRRHLADLSLLAIACIMALYHLVFWLFRRDDMQLILFSGVAFLFGVRIIGTQSLLQQAFPEADLYETEFMMEYLGYYLLVPVFFSYLRAWYRREFLRIVSYALWVVGALFSATVFFAPVDFYSNFVRYYEIVSLGVFVYTLIALGLAIARKQRGSWIITAGILIIIGTATHDILGNMGVIKTEFYVAQFGFLIFLLSQSSLMAALFSDAFRQAEDLSENLERKVVSRTEELEREKDRAEEARATALSMQSESEILAGLSRKANESHSVGEILSAVADITNQRYGADSLFLILADQDKKVFYTRAYLIQGQRGELRDLPEVLREFPLTEESGTFYRALTRGRVVHIPFVDPNWLREKSKPIDVAFVKYWNVGWFAYLPLVSNREVIGLLGFSGNEPRRLRKPDLVFCERMAAQVAGAVRTVELLRQTEVARNESDRLLNNILPDTVANELKANGFVEPLFYELVSVMFTDFVGFTSATESMLPDELIAELDGCFSQFDEVMKRNGLEKLKTIGDAYMCAGGLPELSRTHPIDACLAALELRAFMRQMAEIKQAVDQDFWQIRIGIHSGPVTAGVIGTSKFSYDIWGDTVNTASRMESAGVAGEINISSDTYDLVKDFFLCEYRGKVEAKGKGQLDMYFLRRIKPELSADDAGHLPSEEFRKRLAASDLTGSGTIHTSPGKSRGTVVEPGAVDSNDTTKNPRLHPAIGRDERDGW